MFEVVTRSVLCHSNRRQDNPWGERKGPVPSRLTFDKMPATSPMLYYVCSMDIQRLVTKSRRIT